MTTAGVLERTRQLQPNIKQQREQWLVMLRAACETINASPSVAATTAAAHFEGLAPIQRDDFLRTAREVATEYGLGVSVSQNDTHLEARFCRKPAPVCTPQHESLLTALRHAMRRSPVS